MMFEFRFTECIDQKIIESFSSIRVQKMNLFKNLV
jgi:hypothetical protein